MINTEESIRLAKLLDTPALVAQLERTEVRAEYATDPAWQQANDNVAHAIREELHLRASNNPSYAQRDLHDHPYGHGDDVECPFGFEHRPLPHQPRARWIDRLTDKDTTSWVTGR